MKEETNLSWNESLKITLTILSWIIMFWVVVCTLINIGIHWYDIKKVFGYGGQIL